MMPANLYLPKSSRPESVQSVVTTDANNDDDDPWTPSIIHHTQSSCTQDAVAPFDYLLKHPSRGAARDGSVASKQKVLDG